MAFCCPFINDVNKVITLVPLGIGIAVHLFNFVCECFCKFLDFVLRTKCVIGSDTCLACVERFAPCDLLDDFFDIYIGE